MPLQSLSTKKLNFGISCSPYIHAADRNAGMREMDVYNSGYSAIWNSLSEILKNTITKALDIKSTNRVIN